MRNYFFQILWISILLVSCKNNTVMPGEELVPYKNKRGLWGYKGDFSQKEIIPCKYDLCYPFVDGVARTVELNKGAESTYGLIDKQGNPLTDCIYDGIAPFEDGTSIVRKNEIYDLLDLSGKRLNTRPYESIKRVMANLLVVSYNKQYGAIDAKGQEIIPCEYEYISSLKDHPELIVHQNDRMAYFNAEGKKMTPFKYKDIMPFYEEHTTVVDTNGLCGFINKAGVEKLFPSGYSIFLLSDGMASLKIGDQLGYISTDGNIAFLKDYGPYETREYASGLVAYTNKNDKWGFYDRSGNTAIPFMYDNVNRFDGDYSLAQKGEKIGLINKKNETILPFAYESMEYVSDSVVMAKLNGKWGIFTIHGTRMMPHLYDGFEVLSEKLILLEVTRLQYYSENSSVFASTYGFFNPLNGKKSVNFEYDDVGKFHDSLCVVFRNMKMGVINQEGELIIPCIYDLPDHPSDRQKTHFEWGILAVKRDGKQGYIDKQGNEYWITD